MKPGDIQFALAGVSFISVDPRCAHEFEHETDDT